MVGLDSIAKRLAEQWRPIVGHEGFYEVSDLGRVRSVGDEDRDIFSAPRGWLRKRNDEAFYSKIDEERERLAERAGLPFYAQWWIEALEEPSLIVAALLVLGATIGIIAFIVRLAVRGSIW